MSKNKLISSIILSFLLLFSFVPLAANAEPVGDVNNVKSNLNKIENELSSNGTSVETELNALIDEMLQDASRSTSAEEAAQIEQNINTLRLLLSDYQSFKLGHTTRGAYHPVYSAAVAGVIAFFGLKGYVLSVELLTHAVNNNTLDSVYWPNAGGRVTSSGVFWSIKNGRSTSGSAAFPNSGSGPERDLYYAIHAFSWKKSGGTVTIMDRYDFQPGLYSGIQGVAVNTMFEAQKAGVIVPFQVRIRR